MEKTVLTAREAAEIMRISPTAMYKLIREDKVPHISQRLNLFHACCLLSPGPDPLPSGCRPG